MSKSVALLLALIFLSASAIAVTPVFSSEPIVENVWVSKSSMQVARSHLGVAVVNGKIYAIGGSTRSGSQWVNVDTNEEYNPATDSWAFKSSMPTPRAGFTTAVYENKIYCIGGSGYAGVNEVYDPATDTWETKTPMPTARTGLQANVVDGKIYLIGGYVLDPNSDQGFSVSEINEVYDPAIDTWTTKTSIPTASAIYASAVVGNEIYVIGGDGAGELNQVYDAETDTWSQKTPLKSSTASAVAGATTGVDAPKRIYVLGQHFHLPQQPYITSAYDPEADRWVEGVAVPTVRRGLSVAVLNEKIYAIGGYTETYSISPLEQNPSVTLYSTVEEYTPFGYGSVLPEVVVVLPENEVCSSVDVALDFTVNKATSWLGYSVDGQDNVTVSGNVTLLGLSDGLHDVTVYARDEFGNVGVSETVTFTVESFPVVPVAAASAASVAVMGVGLLVYFKKRKC